MKTETGIGKPGIPAEMKPHLGDILLEKYEDRIMTGFEELRHFEQIDRLEKPVLSFIFYGSKKKILEVYALLSEFPYAFTIRTKKGLDLWSLPERGSRNAYAHISRFPKLIKYIEKHENDILGDLWRILYGYPLREVHQFTYNTDTWTAKKRISI